jgi:hypothetical protein
VLIEVLRWDGLAWVSVAEWDGYEMTVYALLRPLGKRIQLVDDACAPNPSANKPATPQSRSSPHDSRPRLAGLVPLERCAYRDRRCEHLHAT